ncbi:MAG: RsfS/YbeB/iojap family protein [Chlamydiia bacterium]
MPLDLSKRNIRIQDIRYRHRGDWVLVDLDEVIIHLFAPEWRERYALERMHH